MKLENEKIIREVWDKRPDWGENGEPHPFFEEFYAGHKLEPGSTALDIGCGKARYAIPLAKDGLKVVGLDPSPVQREGALKKLAAAGVEAEIIDGWSSRLEFPDQSFDFVVSVGAIHHNEWPDIQKSFAEAARVLKPGKYFLFQGRSTSDSMQPREQLEDPGYTAVDLTGDKQRAPQHYFTREELVQLAEENGLEIVGEPEERIKIKDDEKRKARWWVVYRKKELQKE